MRTWSLHVLVISKLGQKLVKFPEDLHTSGSTDKISKWSYFCMTFKKVPRDSVAKHVSGEVSILKTGLGIEFERHFCPEYEPMQQFTVACITSSAEVAKIFNDCVLIANGRTCLRAPVKRAVETDAETAVTKKRRISQSSIGDGEDDEDDHDSGIGLPTSEPDLVAMRAQIKKEVRAQLEAELKPKYKVRVSPKDIFPGPYPADSSSVKVLEEQAEKALTAIDQPFRDAVAAELEWLPEKLDLFTEKVEKHESATSDLLSKLKTAQWAKDELLEEQKRLL